MAGTLLYACCTGIGLPILVIGLHVNITHRRNLTARFSPLTHFGVAPLCDKVINYEKSGVEGQATGQKDGDKRRQVSAVADGPARRASFCT